MRELNTLPRVLDVQHSHDLTSVTYDGWMRPAFLLLLAAGALYGRPLLGRNLIQGKARVTFSLNPSACPMLLRK